MPPLSPTASLESPRGWQPACPPLMFPQARWGPLCGGGGILDEKSLTSLHLLVVKLEAEPMANSLSRCALTLEKEKE